LSSREAAFFCRAQAVHKDEQHYSIPYWYIQKSQGNVMATGAPSASGRSSQAAYPALRSRSKKLFGREAEPSFVFQQ
jgi:hypothetical protein